MWWIVAMIIVVGLVILVVPNRDESSSGGSYSIERARSLVPEAVRWAQQELPPSQPKLTSLPEGREEEWREYGVVGGVAVAFLVFGSEADEEIHTEAWNVIEADLDDISSSASKAAFQISQRLKGAMAGLHPQGKTPAFVMGHWLWENIYGDELDEQDEQLIEDVGALVVAAFTDWWTEGTKTVVVTGDG